MTAFVITAFGQDEVRANIDALGAMMRACVHAGASIGYILPYSHDDGVAFWRQKVLPRLDGGNLLLLVARAGERIAGAVQLDYDTPPNQPHRAEVRKLMVHPDFRRRGLARLLMAEVEASARALGRSLLTLDTRTGDHAEPLYASIGYRTSGIIPGYCLDPFKQEFDSTTIMFKQL
ncbi:MAG: GNAT family N-acetyltransferase [Mesorhizobium sp.]|nr:GNAT family N-acetyltransferase [Mesorhizobium sp.]